MALSDEQVNAEMQRLINFIKIEAMEKAREIHIKSNEDSAIEKAKIVQQEMAKIDELYKQKMKKAAMTQQISKSNKMNSSRLKLLIEKEKILQEIFEEVKGIIQDLTEDKERYQELLKVLILQGLYQLMEKNIIIRARETDSAIIEKAIDNAVDVFKHKTHTNIDVQIDKEYLCSDGLGGIIIFEATKNIFINNTFEERLELLKKEALPTIRLILFG
ncbi:uncharacterized protein T551_03607 [Pneumocystis jirovecii RU7]|nr:uncharacterized protein T551_03607 [Pneumocystis jirovecii RU7]KTW26309.1 hypothetical protein T551_03607 [Pneumocystis jirovecii RU7]